MGKFSKLKKTKPPGFNKKSVASPEDSDETGDPI